MPGLPIKTKVVHIHVRTRRRGRFTPVSKVSDWPETTALHQPDVEQVTNDDVVQASAPRGRTPLAPILLEAGASSRYVLLVTMLGTPTEREKPEGRIKRHKKSRSTMFADWMEMKLHSSTETWFYHRWSTWRCGKEATPKSLHSSPAMVLPRISNTTNHEVCTIFRTCAWVAGCISDALRQNCKNLHTLVPSRAVPAKNLKVFHHHLSHL